MKMPHLANDDVLFLCDAFATAGHDVRVVGGAVRDGLLGMTPKDIDLATNATPDQMVEIARKANIPYIPTGLQHGTITLLVNGVPYEVTTLRVDVETDGRHAKVEFTTDWRADAARRDLTINAMSYDPRTDQLYDYFGGAEDLRYGVVRFVGDPADRLDEDVLRILRYYRFHGRFSSGAHDDATVDAITRKRFMLDRISGERVWMEKRRILAHASATRVLSSMVEHSVFDHALPGALWDHTWFSEACALSLNPITRLSTLTPKDNVDVLNARLKLSGDELKLLRFLTDRNGVHLNFSDLKDIATTKDHGKDYAVELAAAHGLGDIHTLIKEWEVPVFPVAGRDLIDQGVQPGPDMGKLLKTLERQWKDSDYRLSKQDLIGCLTE